MRAYDKFYINGQWVDPAQGGEVINVINPATEQVAGSVRQASEADVNLAVDAAYDAFPGFSRTPLNERLELMETISSIYKRRMGEMADAITEEMGAPLDTISRALQAPTGLVQLQSTIAAARAYEFERQQGGTLIVKEPVGVCVLITPWNWPMNQIACKVAPALATGCTMVLKPSEMAPFSAQLFAEIMHEAGVPAGVFNMIHGDGAKLGPLLSSHAKVDMVSLTGSTRAGVSVSVNAANTVKVVSLELGGKSANIILDDADLEQAVTHGVLSMMNNSGQSCNAPSRMLVPEHRLEEVEQIAAAALNKLVVGDPKDPATTTGPIANERQYGRVQSLIEKGMAEGAKVVAGGTGRPEGLDKGFFVRPTIFSRANNDMTIAREEIFGPVLTIIPYRTEEEAIAIANDTVYGLSGYVFGGTVERASAVARQLRTGMVHLNGASLDLSAPFGGYKQSGRGREWGAAGMDEFLETKSVVGTKAA